MRRFFLMLTIAFALSGAMLQPASATLTQDINKQVNAANDKAGLADQEAREYIASVVPILLSITGTIFLILLIYAGYVRLSSHGDEDRIKKSTKTTIAAVIGLTIVFLAYAITRFVLPRVYNATTTDPRYEESNQFPDETYGTNATIQIF